MFNKLSKEFNIIRKDPKLVLTLPIALFILLLLLPFKKLFYFRFGFLHSDRIGHFAMNTELSILEDKKLKKKSVHDFYYFGGKICNNFLGKKWSEILNIYPKIFIRPFCLICRSLKFLNHNIAGSTISSDNDIMNLFEKYPSQIKLNKKEIAILKLMFYEKSNVEIAEILNIPRPTVNTYRTRMIAKVGAVNTVGLILYAIRKGICTLQ